MYIIKSSTEMKLKPIDTSTLETECLFGENVQILEEHFDWVYCKLLTDSYLGWLKKENLGFFKKSTHRVISNRTFVYFNNEVKSKCYNYIPIGSLISVKKIRDDWAEIYLSNKQNYKTAFIPSKDIVIINSKVSDWVSTAEGLLGTPYKWGGRDSLGLDCSALLQLSYQTYGENIPRNTSDQLNINKEIITNLRKLNRGFVVFWEGHVSIMTDNVNCIHANAFHMKTIIEPLEVVMDRMKNDYKIVKIMNFN